MFCLILPGRKGPSLLKMEMVYGSKISVTIYQPAWCHSAEDSNVHNHHLENLRSYKDFNNSRDA
jgi:hypothetical protein